MKLKSELSVLNFGDTSFRRKSYMVEYKVLLSILEQHMEEYEKWSSDAISQRDFYEKILAETDLFEREEKGDDNLAKRGRTLTNSLVKTGLITNERNITPVGKNWLYNQTSKADEIELIFDVTNDNLVFLRQWLKFRLFSIKGDKFFSPFIWAIKFLSRYSDVPFSDFITILHTIKPENTEEELNNIFDEYASVAQNNKLFDEYADEYLDFNNVDKQELKIIIKNIFDSEEINLEDFNIYFKNGKSQEVAGEEYKKFIELLKKFKEEKSLENMNNIIEYGKRAKIKKAFGFGKQCFNTSRKRNYTVENFLVDNEDNALLEFDPYEVYLQFKKSKRYDLVSEYGDLTRRLLTLTGIIEFDNKLVNTQFSKVFKEIFAYSQINFIGNMNYKVYEGDIRSDFYNEKTLLDIFNLNFENTKEIFKNLSSHYEVKDLENLRKYFENEKDRRFKDLIESRFSKDNVIDILGYISQRDDKKVKRLVTLNTDVPTIFEYILGIAWYYISDEKINVRKSLNLTLDADLLPLSHASGGGGDIIVGYDELTIMLEATLMNKNAQRRSELEPVIRHAANLSITEINPVITVFIADELDNNVLNIFRASSYIEFEGTNVEGRINGVNIFALKISEVINMLSSEIYVNKLIETINNNFNSTPQFINSNWRDKMIDHLFN